LHLYDNSHLGGAMVGMVISSSVDHGFERRLSQPKDLEFRRSWAFIIRKTTLKRNQRVPNLSLNFITELRWIQDASNK
jgi:hypothetical protein